MVAKYILAAAFLLLLNPFYAYAQETAAAEATEPSETAAEQESEYSSLTDIELDFRREDLQAKKKNTIAWATGGSIWIVGGIAFLIIGSIMINDPSLGSLAAQTGAIWVYSGIAFLAAGSVIAAISLPIAIVRSSKIKAIEREKIRRAKLSARQRPSELALLISPMFIGFRLSFRPRLQGGAS